MNNLQEGSVAKHIRTQFSSVGTFQIVPSTSEVVGWKAL